MPQPQLPRIAPEDMPEHIRHGWERSMALRGDATWFEVMAHAPELYDWYGEFYERLFRGGRVERVIKELARLRLSTTHGCRFCNQGNRPDALEAGVAQEQIDQLDEYESGPFSERERAALALADQMVLTNPSGTLDAALHERLKKHFDPAEIMELGMVMAVLTGMAKMLFTFDLVEKENNCPFPASRAGSSRSQGG